MSCTINEYDLRSSFARERKLLLLAGVYPNPPGKKRTRGSLAVEFFTLLISYAQLLTMIVQLGVDRKNLSKLISTLVYFSTHSTFLYKLYNFQTRSPTLLGIERFLTDPTFYYFSFGQLQMIKEKIKCCDVIAAAYRICVVVTCTTYCMVPYIDGSMKGSLPLPGWFPYDTTKLYLPTYVFQAVSIALSAHCNTAIDVLTWKLLTLAAAQFDILKGNLTDIDFVRADRAKKALLDCIIHHRKILSLSKQVQDVFSRGMFLQLFCSCLAICTTGFHLMIVPMQSFQFLFGTFYLSGMICQIAAYCWYGHRVMTTSDEIGRSLYLSNWYLSDQRTRKVIAILLENVRAPSSVKAGNFITLSLATLTQILRSAYSYFAVLQRLYNQE